LLLSVLLGEAKRQGRQGRQNAKRTKGEGRRTKPAILHRLHLALSSSWRSRPGTRQGGLLAGVGPPGSRGPRAGGAYLAIRPLVAVKWLRNHLISGDKESGSVERGERAGVLEHLLEACAEQVAVEDAVLDLALAPALDDPGLDQPLEVVAGERRADAERLAQLR